MQSPKIQHWTWHSTFWKKLTNKLMTQRKRCTISCRKTLHKQPYSRHLFSTHRPLYCISQYFYFTSFLAEVCYIFWFYTAAHEKKLNNYLLTVEVYRKNIKVKKWKNSTNYSQLDIDYFVNEILWNIKVQVTCNFKTIMEVRKET